MSAPLTANPAPGVGPLARDNALPTKPAVGNTSFVLRKIHDTGFEDRPIIPPGPGEVQINIRSTGLCGSDSHYVNHGRIGDFILTGPMVLGHESAGTVTALGAGVTTHKVGDRVALEPGKPCFSCPSCLSGNYNHCADMVFAATPPYDGTLATFYNLHASFAHKVPDSMTFEEAALMEPLSVAVHAAVRMGQVKPLQNVLVFGAGPVGLFAAAVAKAYGAKTVTTVDVVPNKLEFAASFAASHTFLPKPATEGETPMQASERNAKALLDMLSGDVAGKGGNSGGVDLVLECTGAQPCIQMGIYALRTKGRFVQVGMGREEATIPVTRLGVREIEMVGSFRYGVGAYRTAIDLVAEGKIQASRLITHRYTFEQCHDAFAATMKGQGEDGKSTIKVNISQGEARA